MGNAPSILGQDKSKKPKDLKKLIDTIAARYIVTQNFKDMINMRDTGYCNKLVIMTSQIIKEYLDYKSVVYLDQHMKGDTVIDKLKKDKVIYLDSNNISELDLEKKHPLKKKRMCIGI